jgi:hypothetical protein
MADKIEIFIAVAVLWWLIFAPFYRIGGELKRMNDNAEKWRKENRYEPDKS